MIKILGYDYTIVCDKDENQMGSSGRSIIGKQKILIATDIHDQLKLSTLLHEIIEVANYSLELKLEHHAIMALEATLYQTLTDAGVDLSPLIKDIK